MEYLKSNGFVQLQSEGSMLFKRLLNGGMDILIIALLYVDDIIFMSRDPESMELEISQFLNRFEESEGNLEFYLGVKIDWKNGFSKCLKLRILTHCSANMAKLQCQATPMVENFHDLLAAHAADEVTDCSVYRHLRGCLLYIAMKTRLDLL